MVQTATTPTPERAEMWVLDLAKSKIILAASKSCELIIFFGTLWLTLVTVVPAASTWLDGVINTVFMAVLSFAVDAAMPESFLHVVGQYIEGKRSQLRWSIPLAVAMFLLVVANVLYSKLDPHGSMPWLINSLLILRMIIGILYVSIRECQNLIDRHHPSVPRATIEQMLTAQSAQYTAQLDHVRTSLTAQVTAQVAQMRSVLAAQVAQIEQAQNDLSVDLSAHQEQAINLLSMQLQTALASWQEHVVVDEIAQSQPGRKRLLPPQNVVALRGQSRATGAQSAAQLSTQERVFELLNEDAQQSDRAIARLLNCAPNTVKRYRELWLNAAHVAQ